MRRHWAWIAVLAVAGGLAAAPPSTRQVWADERTNLLGGLSPDGKLLSYVDPQTGDLGVYEIGTGQTRLLTNNPVGAPTFAYFSAFSRDGESLAYAWFNEQGFYELWTVGVDGGKPRRLYSNPENGFVQPCDWSLDGTEILTLFFRKDNVSQIALVNAEDGSMRVLKTLSWFYPKKISYSPDGRHILYDSLTGRGGTARDILLLDADGGSERKLIEHEANDIFPLWTPAGDGVVFASDRAGEMDLWVAPVADGAVAGEPYPVARRFGRALPLGVTREGAYYFGLRAGGSNVRVARLEDGDAVAPQTAGVRTVGRNLEPTWAPDGKRLAFLTQLGTENYGLESRGVVVWVPATGQETVVVPQLASIARIRWSPDGSRLLASGSDGRGRSGLFTVDPDTGATQGLIREHGGAPEGLEGAWASKDAVAYIAEDGSRVLVRSLHGDDDAEVFAVEAGGALQGLEADTNGLLYFGLTGPEGTTLRSVGVNGAGARLLTELPGPVESIEVAGKTVYASVRRDGRVETWEAPAAGGAARKSALPSGLRLSPKGKMGAYTDSDQREEVWALEGWLRSITASPAADPVGAASETPPGAP